MSNKNPRTRGEVLIYCVCEGGKKSPILQRNLRPLELRWEDAPYIFMWKTLMGKVQWAERTGRIYGKCKTCGELFILELDTSLLPKSDDGEHTYRFEKELPESPLRSLLGGGADYSAWECLHRFIVDYPEKVSVLQQEQGKRQRVFVERDVPDTSHRDLPDGAPLQSWTPVYITFEEDENGNSVPRCYGPDDEGDVLEDFGEVPA